MTDEPTSMWPKWHCPTHRKPLEEMHNALACPDGDSFSRDGEIPRFVRNSFYADAFGVQWKKYRRIQLDSYNGFPITRDRARRCIGDALWESLSGKQVLECGCGAGRFTEILLQRGAHVTSIDLSDAVDANQENFPQDQTHRIAQADILRLPFAPKQFDVVFCLGVVQHTPSPEETMARLFEQVKPGGTLVLDHYTHDFSWYTKTAPLIRLWLKRLAPQDGIWWTERIVDLLLPLHKMVRHIHPAQALLSRVSPVLCYYHAYPYLTDDDHRELALLDTHDSLTAWYMHFRTRRQIQRTLENLGLSDIWSSYSGNGVEARGRRPL